MSQSLLEDLKAEAGKPHRRVYIALALILTGLMIEMAALLIGAILGVQAGDYYSNTKAVRDAAPAGSRLLADIGGISAVSTWLEPLRFVGFATFFAGIVAALSAIVPRIQLRAATLAAAISAVKASRGPSQ